MPPSSPDFELRDGRGVNFDLYAISIKEYRRLFDVNQPDVEEYATVAKVTGLSADDIAALPMMEYRRLFKAMLDKAREPLENPT